jgi:hypothetical protein
VIVIGTYQRNPFPVQAVQVTPQNMAELAEWCGGEVKYLRTTEYTAATTRIIEVPLRGSKSDRGATAPAHVGDWITRLRDSVLFRVYRNKAFLDGYEPVRDMTETREAILLLIKKVSHDPGIADPEEITAQIIDLFGATR